MSSLMEVIHMTLISVNNQASNESRLDIKNLTVISETLNLCDNVRYTLGYS